MDVMLNTIAVEPNRWTPEKKPHVTIEDLLEPIRKAGFHRIEMWQYHVSGKSTDDVRKLWKKIDKFGMRVDVVGGYPLFHLEGKDGDAEKQTRMDLLEKTVILGASKLKIFLGRVKGSEADEDTKRLTARRVKDYQKTAQENGVRISAELHGGTMLDPLEAGLAFLKENDDLDLDICYQPYDFTSTEKCLKLADTFKGQITHVHLQGHKTVDGEQQYSLLENADIDYRQLLPKLAAENKNVTFGIEFVKDCVKPVEHFNIKEVLENARRDADFVRDVLGFKEGE